MSYTKIMPRGGTKYEWTTMNPVLAEREMAVEYPDSGIGTGLCRFKFGDGFKTYNELAYAFDGASASSMIGGNAFTGNLFQIRADTHENWLLANPVLEENELVYDTTYNCFYIGDGASRFNQLKPAGRDDQRVYDFGDEDEDEIKSPLVANAPQGQSLFSAGTSTLGDLMDMALGGMIEPQPIEGGTPLILDSVSAPEQDVDAVDTDTGSEEEIAEDVPEESTVTLANEGEIVVDDGYSILDEKEDIEPEEEQISDTDEAQEQEADTANPVDQFLENNSEIVEEEPDDEELNDIEEGLIDEIDGDKEGAEPEITEGEEVTE